MLALFSISLVSLIICCSFVFVWPLFCIGLFFNFVLSQNSFFNSPISFSQSFSIQDSISLFIVFLIFFIIYISYINSYDFYSYKLIGLVFLFLTYFCYEVFTTSHLFNLYFFYEASLIPIIYIIVNWGSYPERSISSIIILVYTLLFGSPVLLIIMHCYSSIGSWLFTIYPSFNTSFLFSIFIFLCFSVKLPIYGLHFWLPIAHVEAPSFGSVILASLLLKLGGVGLVRLESLLDHTSLINSSLSYFMIFIIYSSLICCYQSDLNRLIAYSSVAHIIVIPFLVMSNNTLAFQSLVLVMLLHGLSSTLLFMSVGVLYHIISSRQLVLMRGLILVSPLFSFLLVITFLFTLSAPPMPSYIAEVFFILSTYILSDLILYVILSFAFLSLVYNLNWLVSVLFSPSLNFVYSNSNLSYHLFLPLISTLLAVFPFTLLFYLL